MSMVSRIVSLLVFLMLIVVMAFLVVVWSGHKERFPLKVVEVTTPLKHVQEPEVRACVLPFLEKGFFGLNVKAVQTALMTLPWVQSAEIRRMWPDRLLVSIKEKIAQAKWGDKGVLSTDGVIFYPDPDSIAKALPAFEGPDFKAVEMQQQYYAFLEQLSVLGLGIQSLKVSLNDSLQMVLDNGLVLILGKQALDERMTRFILAYQNRLEKDKERIQYVDLRYTNGFAVGFRKEGLGFNGEKNG